MLLLIIMSDREWNSKEVIHLNGMTVQNSQVWNFGRDAVEFEFWLVVDELPRAKTYLPICLRNDFITLDNGMFYYR